MLLLSGMGGVKIKNVRVSWLLQLLACWLALWWIMGFLFFFSSIRIFKKKILLFVLVWFLLFLVVVVVEGFFASSLLLQQSGLVMVHTDYVLKIQTLQRFAPPVFSSIYLSFQRTDIIYY